MNTQNITISMNAAATTEHTLVTLCKRIDELETKIIEAVYDEARFHELYLSAKKSGNQEESRENHLKRFGVKKDAEAMRAEVTNLLNTVWSMYKKAPVDVQSIATECLTATIQKLKDLQKRADADAEESAYGVDVASFWRCTHMMRAMHYAGSRRSAIERLLSGKKATDATDDIMDEFAMLLERASEVQ